MAYIGASGSRIIQKKVIIEGKTIFHDVIETICGECHNLFEQEITSFPEVVCNKCKNQKEIEINPKEIDKNESILFNKKDII